MRNEPTGKIDRLGDVYTLRLNRTFSASIEDVWAAVTEPDRLARWIGTFTGDPAEGQVVFQMTAEEGEPVDQKTEILQCQPPKHLSVVIHFDTYQWHLNLDLDEKDDITTLTFSQPNINADEADSVGPGWEYYLDRLVAVETGENLNAIDFGADYYPAMQGYYRSLF